MFTAEYFDVEATEFQLEPAATLDCSGRGSVYHSKATGANSSTAAAGAGHGSIGGHSMSGASGGQSYGSIYRPVMFGARGGSGPGGMGTRGGGKMRIRVGNKFILDGVLAADGISVNGATGKILIFLLT